ncbi:MAG TPA: DUF255 domain-containing protein [Steroidobacteraceae bacterium]|jgi:uncharacterized protein YyaL (SSP411 family)|nr:DUF255 domain-containing protein [Steroidobacteraceae bacterium]
MPQPRKFPRLLSTLAALAALGCGCAQALAATAAIHWQTQWNPALFTQAARAHRFVLLDLHAVWCHWCHVMDEQTYADPKVTALIGQRYLAVSIDADSDPDLASRYADWGWPATIVLAADGTEIVKRRGFLSPEQMASLLQAIIDDPTPGPSVGPAVAVVATRAGGLSAAQRAAFRKTYLEAYDSRYGGWGRGQKFLDAATLEYTLALAGAERDPLAERRARETLNANLRLIDPVWGGVWQYSATRDWAAPHYEKLLSFQADDLRLYAEAYARWQDPRYLGAALALERYASGFLRSPAGAFYVSQDADLSATMTGHEYYARDDAARRRLGIPRIDTHEYARENGGMIRALCRLYEVSGQAAALASAERAAEWVSTHRALPGGGFSHDRHDQGGPYLDDTLAMGEAFLALYRATSGRQWLARAQAALRYIAREFPDRRGGFMSAPAPAGASGVFKDPTRTIAQSAALVRLANLLQHYSGDPRDAATARQAMRFLAAAGEPDQLGSDILLADRELSGAPIHITVVGGKQDPAAQALHAAALQFPATYLQVDWWDAAEGPLPNPQVHYPQLARAAAFACSGSTCSTPVFEPEGVARTVASALYP